ncbi:OmpA family protein [Arenimonas alkanexedens]
MRPSLILPLMVALLALPGLAPAQSTAEHEQAVARLVGELRALETDPSLADLAGLERLKARQAVAAASDAKRRERQHSVVIAELRIAAARAAAEADLLAAQSLQLDRERDQIMLESSRREAEQARRENERLRLQSLARIEASQRQLQAAEAAQTIALEAAEAETAQARKLAQARAREAELARKEAELAAAVAADDIRDAPAPPSRQAGGSTIHTLDGNAFGSGSASLTSSAQASLRTLATQLSGGGTVRIEGHTDSQGADAANQALSKRRADAVRRALEDGGLSPGRLSATGLGETRPVADNASADGRARNRRVEIIVE